MKLDDDVETAVRDAYGAALDRDLDGVGIALEDCQSAGAFESLQVAQVLLTSLLWWQHDLQRPTVDEVNDLAERVVAEEGSWSPVPAVASFRTQLLRSSGHPTNGVLDSSETVLVLVYAATNLLRHLPADRPWYQVLDEIEAIIEAGSAGWVASRSSGH